MGRDKRPFKLFVSYAHKDEDYKDEMVVHLKPLERAGFIDKWDDREILPGTEWDDDIKAELESSDIIVFLVSPYFMASDYIHDKEIGAAIARHQRGEVIIVPVIIKPVDLSLLTINNFQALPRNAKPISTWPNADEGWLDVTTGIRKLVQSLEKKGSNSGGNNDSDTGNGGAQPINPSPQITDNTPGIDINRYKLMIAEGKTGELIKELLGLGDAIDRSLQNNLILQSGKWNSIIRDETMGIRSQDDLNREKSRINMAMMYILDQIG